MHASLAAKTLIAAAALTLAAGAAASAEEKPMQRTVTVSAAGQVSAEPDLARISTGIVTEAKAARDALARNSETMKALIAGLKSSGIEAKDIQTSSFHVEPRYTSPREGQAAAIDGYRVVNQVQVTARNLAKLGEVLDALVGLGANQMGGLAFEVSKAESLKDEARKEAMANALRRAKLLASAGGAEVGEVIAISEDVSDGGPRPLAMARTAMAEAVPIERGTETLVARVTVTWALK
ncbi:MAG TPA: SIMPL domain-containing protein [Hyphomicrobiaceae bacterium]|nr:SIMPL domain-containing protein [Hyphomicrobiaceae bacterium]